MIDCRINSGFVSQLLDALNKGSKIKRFSLTQVHHSDNSFDKLIEYVETSTTLQELDISWSMVRPQIMMKLLRVIRQNRDLTCLSLGWNELIDEKEQGHFLTLKQKQEGMTEVALTEFNQEVLDCLSDFTKYNAKLIHLDLQKTGLSEPILRYFGKILRRAQSLRAIHLCGNPGLSVGLVEYLQERIHADMDDD